MRERGVRERNAKPRGKMRKIYFLLSFASIPVLVKTVVDARACVEKKEKRITK